MSELEEYWGVMSCATDELDSDDKTEHFLALWPTKLEAMVSRDRLVVHYAMHLIPKDVFLKLLAALFKNTEELADEKIFNVAGTSFYVRQMTEAELSAVALSADLNGVS